MKPAFHSANSSAQHRGFTVIELLVVIAILGVLAALAAPSFTETIKRYRVNSIRDNMTSAIQLARSEAIRRRQQISLIRIGSCSGVTLATVNDWDCGWEVGLDANSDGDFSDVDDLVLQSFSVPTGFRLAHGATAASASMLVTRFGQPGTSSERFMITPPEGTTFSETKVICFYPGGRVRSTKGTPACATL